MISIQIWFWLLYNVNMLSSRKMELKYVNKREKFGGCILCGIKKHKQGSIYVNRKRYGRTLMTMSCKYDG